MVLFLFLLLVISGVFIGFISPQVGFANEVLGAIQFTITISLFLVSALKNPGVVLASMQMKNKPDFNTSMEKVCTECNLIREGNTEHCKKCKMCILDFDDHYFFLGKCVGKYTIKVFYALLLSFLTMAVFIIATLFLRFQYYFD